MTFRQLEFEQSMAFKLQADKTQILIPGIKRDDLYKNRQSHVYEVKAIGELIADKIKFKKTEAIAMVCLAHDLGHSPFGHDGQKVLDKVVKSFGLNEGFHDNNNNFNVIWNNGLDFTSYQEVSLIKYPDQLHVNQKQILLPILEKVLEKERILWGNNLKRTVACEIMDFADEIAYGTSDLLDGYSTGYTEKHLLEFFDSLIPSSQIYLNILNILRLDILNKDKRSFRHNLIELKKILIKQTFWDYTKAKVSFKSKESSVLLSKLISFNREFFIYNSDVLEERKKALDIFEKFCIFFMSCDISFIPSKMYSNKLLNASNNIENLKIRRDMIADSSDQFVLSYKINNG